MHSLWQRLILAAFIMQFAAIEPASAGQIMYGSRLHFNNNNPFPVHELDPTTGAILSSVDVSGHEVLFSGITADANGDLYAIDGFNDSNQDRLFRIDPTTGAGTVVGNTGFNWNFRYIEFNPVTGVLYGGTDFSLYTINKTTGAATFVTNITAASQLDQVTALAIDNSGNAYITDWQNTSLFSLNLTTGVASHLGNLNPGINDDISDLAFDENNVLYATGAFGPGTVSIIDIVNVQHSPAFTNGTFYNGLAFHKVDTVGAPEPTSLALLGLGTMGLAVGRRFKRRSQE